MTALWHAIVQNAVPRYATITGTVGAMGGSTSTLRGPGVTGRRSCYSTPFRATAGRIWHYATLVFARRVIALHDQILGTGSRVCSAVRVELCNSIMTIFYWRTSEFGGFRGPVTILRQMR